MITTVVIIIASLLISPTTTTPSPRVVVTFRNASLNTEAVAPENTAVVKQYGRRLVLRVDRAPGGEDWEQNSSSVSEWIQDALGGEELVERVEQDALASAFLLDNTNNSDGNETEFTANVTFAQSSSVPFPTLLSGWNLNDSEPFSLHLRSLRQLTDGAGATIAIVDSGIAEAAKPLFRPSVGFDFISSPDHSNKADQKRNPDYTDPGDQGPTCTTPSWHGTKVASIAAVAIAPGATLSIMRVLGRCGVGFSSDIADAVVWAAGGQINGLSANPFPAKVISLSLAGKNPCPSYLQSAVNQARSLGATVIAAAGNAAQNASLYFPANCNGVLAIGASTRQGTIAPYSNWGPALAFSAQGGDSTNPIPVLSISSATGQLVSTFAVGTSFAAPHVAGCMALLEGIGMGVDSVALVAFDSMETKEGGGGIISFGITDPRQGILTPRTSTASNVSMWHNSSTVSASGACIGSRSNGWWIPNQAGKKQGQDTEPFFECPYPCFMTSLEVCDVNRYFKIGCSDGSAESEITYSTQLGITGSCPRPKSTFYSSSGFSKIRAFAGNDVNGLILTSRTGIEENIGCYPSCQTQYDLSCDSNPDGLKRTVSGIVLATDSQYVHAFTLYCTVYTCPPNTHYMSPTHYICQSCDVCPKGSYMYGCGGSNSGDCTPCQRGSGDTRYRAGCGGLSAGYVAYCSECGAGTKFSGCTGDDLEDSRTCQACDAGTYGGGGRSRSCTPCAAGKYNPNQGSANEGGCISCTPGKYNPNSGSVSSGSCEQCGKGKYNPNSGSNSESACKNCLVGTYGPGLGAGGCIQCSEGKYNDQEGRSYCTDCSAGTYNNIAGKDGAQHCIQCPSGTYSLVIAATTPSICLNCDSGKYSPSAGRSVCDKCEAGKYGPGTRLSACTNCAAGTYSTELGRTGVCVPCASGTYNADTGGSSPSACQPCNAGRYGPSAGISVCPQCGAGKFQASGGKTICDTCTPGTYTTDWGSVSCQPCVPLTTCAIGWESTCIPDRGSECVQCTPIYACTYQRSACFVSGSTTLPDCHCAPGFELLDNICKGCPSGKFKSTSGAGRCASITTALACGQGTYMQHGTAFTDSACIACPPLPDNAVQGVQGCEWSCAAGFDNNAP